MDKLEITKVPSPGLAYLRILTDGIAAYVQISDEIGLSPRSLENLKGLAKTCRNYAEEYEGIIIVPLPKIITTVPLGGSHETWDDGSPLPEEGGGVCEQ